MAIPAGVDLKEWRSVINRTVMDKGCSVWTGGVDRYGRAVLDNGTLALLKVAENDVVEAIKRGAIPTHTCGRKACLTPDHIRAAPGASECAYKYPLIMNAVDACIEAGVQMARSSSDKRRVALVQARLDIEEAVKREVESIFENAFNIAARRK